MLPSSRCRVAAWLLALPLGRRDCALRGRLEMISFWLLCWKLLRATAGLRRPAGELTDGNQADGNHADGNHTDDNHADDNHADSNHPSDEPVTMEISSSPPLLMDLERENIQNYKEHEEEEDEPHYPEVHGTHQPFSNEQEEDCDYLVFEIGKKNASEQNRNQEDTSEFDWMKEMESKEENEEEVEETSSQSELLFPSGVEDGGQSESIFPSDAEQVWAHDLGPRDDLSDCLQAELAAVYSDSDAGDDQWAASINSDVISQTGRDTEDREDSLIDKSSEQTQQEGVQAVNQEQSGDQERSDSREQMASRRDLFLRGSSGSSTASSTDPDRKHPSDFCVQQDIQSENVSTEHVDFLLARQQWKKMEEEVKGRPIPKPGLRAQGSFQGTHSSLYPPTRSPRLRHRELQPTVPREPPLSSTLSPGSEDSGLDDSLYRSPLEEPESAVEREIRLTLEREEKHRRERGLIEKGISVSRPSSLQTSRSPPRPPACRTPTLSVSPSCSSSSSSVPRTYHELTANNVIILEPDTSPASRSRLISSATGGLSDWPSSTANVVVVETSNLIIRSASEFCLNSSPISADTQESTFSSNPFFKLRSLSSQSLVEQEIRLVRQREEEWKRQRDEMFRTRREKYHTVLVSPGLSDNISINVPEVADRCVSSPSSPSRARKMERSSLSCDQKFPSSLSSVPKRQNAMAQRWEASLLANQKKD